PSEEAMNNKVKPESSMAKGRNGRSQPRALQRCRRRTSCVSPALILRLLIVLLAIGSAAVEAKPKTPNILFVIMDDVGIDQMRVFGYGGGTPPPYPNIDTIARAG